MEAGRGDYAMMESRDEEIGVIMKGKRTKRQRLQYSLPFSISPSPSEEAFLEVHNNGGSAVFSSSYSLDQVQTSADEDEEQDMAHCLILLAQGVRSRENTAPATSPASFRAKRKLGRSCDYECKTCGRTFHSFQALGGHRASHKKPKAVSAIEDAKKELQLSFQGGGEEEEQEGDIKNRFFHPLSLSLNPRTQSGNNNKSNKTHECSICGAEFSSGQALGGHMRRHRAPLMAASPSSSFSNPLREKQPHKRKRRGISLDLDLNLPAMPEDDRDQGESRLMSFISSKHHVFSCPALVDCHY